MRTDDTHRFMALCSIAQHFGRPSTSTDQASIFIGDIAYQASGAGAELHTSNPAIPGSRLQPLTAFRSRTSSGTAASPSPNSKTPETPSSRRSDRASNLRQHPPAHAQHGSDNDGQTRRETPITLSDFPRQRQRSTARPRSVRCSISGPPVVSVGELRAYPRVHPV